MKQKSWLDRSLSLFTEVHAGEGGTALLLAANLFCLFALYYVLKPVRESLILSESGAVVKSYAAAGQALLLLGLVPAYGALASRVSRVPFIGVVTMFFASNLIVFWSGWTTDWKLFVAVLLGFIVLGIFRLTGQVTSPMEWRSGATWVIPWLAGLAVVSWLGSFGGGRGYITFEIGFAVVAGLSLLIYWLAYQVRLAPAIVAGHVEESRTEAAVEEQELGTAAI